MQVDEKQGTEEARMVSSPEGDQSLPNSVQTAVLDPNDPIPIDAAYMQSLPQEDQERFYGLAFSTLDGPEDISPERGQLLSQLQEGQKLVEDDEFQYVTLLNNGSNNDIGETSEAKTMAEVTRNLLHVFSESLHELYEQNGGENKNALKRGQPVLWHMHTKNRNGLPGSQGFDLVILNPTRQPGHNKPVVEIVFPHTNVLKTVNQRLEQEKLATQQQSQGKSTESDPEKGVGQSIKPIKTLAWVSNPHQQRQFAEMTVNMLADNGDRPTAIARKLKAMKGGLADIRDEHKPDQKESVEQRLGLLAKNQLGLTPAQAQGWTQEAYKALGPARYTYFPQIQSGAYQPLEPQAIPVQYKGVELQQAEVRNLLTGNAVELKGLKDERRASPYRAVVNWNLLTGQTYTREDQKEELKTDRKKEVDQHQKVVNGQGSDSLNNDHLVRQDQQRRQEGADSKREDTKRQNKGPRHQMVH